MPVAAVHTNPVQEPTEYPDIDRESKIPAENIKMTPENDPHPPITLSDEYEQPVPLPYPVNTRGAEDSAFIMPDGETLYVWFTPDTKMDVRAQAVDEVTGIYMFRKNGDDWFGPERVWLIEPGKAVLDGCEFVLDNMMWFCTAREGYTGIHWANAHYVDGKWTDWEISDFDPELDVGELHITADGSEMYYHSARPGGKGGFDIWVSNNVGGEWQEPENIAVVNSEYVDGWPFVSQDGSELWFTRMMGAPDLWRSKKIDGQWQEPEKMIQTFAGESSMDEEGNVYFTHHFYEDDKMLEADIYVAYRR